MTKISFKKGAIWLSTFVLFQILYIILCLTQVPFIITIILLCLNCGNALVLVKFAIDRKFFDYGEKE